MDAGHIPVLLHECIENLNIRPDGIYVDGTLGMGGHSEQIAGRLTSGTLVCIDRDETAIARAISVACFGVRFCTDSPGFFVRCLIKFSKSFRASIVLSSSF